MGRGRADEVGPWLAQDVEEASAGNGRAQSSVPAFLERRKYMPYQCLYTFKVIISAITYDFQKRPDFLCCIICLHDEKPRDLNFPFIQIKGVGLYPALFISRNE